MTMWNGHVWIKTKFIEWRLRHGGDERISSYEVWETWKNGIKTFYTRNVACFA